MFEGNLRRVGLQSNNLRRRTTAFNEVIENIVEEEKAKDEAAGKLAAKAKAVPTGGSTLEDLLGKDDFPDARPSMRLGELPDDVGRESQSVFLHPDAGGPDSSAFSLSVRRAATVRG